MSDIDTMLTQLRQEISGGQSVNDMLAGLRAELTAPAPEPIESSAAGAFGRGAARSVVPTIGGLAGAKAGAAGGAALGSLIAPGPGTVIGGVLGGIGGAVTGGFAASEAQEYVLDQTLDPHTKAALDAQLQADREQHPVASFAGEVVPSAIAFKPSVENIRRAGQAITSLGSSAGRQTLARSPHLQSAAADVIGGGAVGGAVEGYRQIQEGEFSPGRLAAEIGVNALLTEPNRIGRKLGFAASPADPATLPFNQQEPGAQMFAGQPAPQARSVDEMLAALEAQMPDTRQFDDQLRNLRQGVPVAEPETPTIPFAQREGVDTGIPLEPLPDASDPYGVRIPAPPEPLMLPAPPPRLALPEPQRFTFGDQARRAHAESVAASQARIDESLRGQRPMLPPGSQGFTRGRLTVQRLAKLPTREIDQQIQSLGGDPRQYKTKAQKIKAIRARQPADSGEQMVVGQGYQPQVRDLARVQPENDIDRMLSELEAFTTRPVQDEQIIDAEFEPSAQPPQVRGLLESRPPQQEIPNAVRQEEAGQEAQAVSEVSGQREPWEMTRGEYVKATKPIRNFQRYSSDQRSDRGASHRLTQGQRQSPGEYFYTSPDAPGVAFPTAKAAKDAGHRTAVERAIVEGKIESHPDYPDLSPAKPSPASVKAQDAPLEASPAAPVAASLTSEDAIPRQDPTRGEGSIETDTATAVIDADQPQLDEGQRIAGPKLQGRYTRAGIVKYLTERPEYQQSAMEQFNTVISAHQAQAGVTDSSVQALDIEGMAVSPDTFKGLSQPDKQKLRAAGVVVNEDKAQAVRETVGERVYDNALNEILKGKLNAGIQRMLGEAKAPNADPDLKLAAWLYENAPRKEAQPKKLQTVAPNDLLSGDTFTIYGQPFTVEQGAIVSENGTRIEIEGLEGIPYDEGSIQNQSEPPPFALSRANADRLGSDTQLGMFGARATEGNTGNLYNQGVSKGEGAGRSTSPDTPQMRPGDKTLGVFVTELVERGITSFDAAKKAIADAGYPAPTKKQLKLMLKARRSAASDAARELRRYPGMDDLQIRQYEDAAVSKVVADLESRGAKRTGDSPNSESTYLTMPDGRRVRVSNHALPMTDERVAASERSNEVHITIDRFLTDEQLKQKVDESLTPDDESFNPPATNKGGDGPKPRAKKPTKTESPTPSRATITYGDKPTEVDIISVKGDDITVKLPDGMNMVVDKSEITPIPSGGKPRRSPARERGAVNVEPLREALRGGKWAAEHTASAAQWLITKGAEFTTSAGKALKALIREFGSGIKKFFKAIWSDVKSGLAAAKRNQQGAVGDVGSVRGGAPDGEPPKPPSKGESRPADVPQAPPGVSAKVKDSKAAQAAQESFGKAGQVIREQSAEAASTAGGVLRFYSEDMIDTLGRKGGQEGKAFAKTARAVVDEAKRLIGSISKTLDAAREAAGRMNSATTWLNRIKQSGENPWGYRNARRVMDMGVEAPSATKDTVEKLRAANLAIGKLAEGTMEGFRASGKYQREGTGFLYDILRSGKGEAWDVLVRALAAENGLDESAVAAILGKIQKDLAEGSSFQLLSKINQEFKREFKNFPSAVKVGNIWHDVLHDAPADYLKRASENTAQRVAFVKAVPEKELTELRGKVRRELGGEGDVFDNLVRALHGIPMDHPYIGLVKPGSFAHRLYAGFNGVLGNFFSPLYLTGASISNMPEVAVGNTPLLLGYKDYLAAFARRKELRPALEELGAINAAFYDWSFDPNGPVRSVGRVFRQGLTVASGNQYLNELQEALAAGTAYVKVERMKAKTLSAKEKAEAIPTLKEMGIEPDVAKRMVDGEATDAQYNAFIRRAAAYLTGGNKLAAEGSRFGNSRVLTGLFKFTSYPMMKVNATRKIVGDWHAAMKGDNRAMKRVQSVRLAKFLFGTTAQGAAITFLYSLATGGTEGLGIAINEAQDEPAEFMAESLISAIGGPMYIAYRAFQQSDRSKVGDIASSATFPGGVIQELADFFQGQGMYRDKTMGERAQTFLLSRVPAGRIATAWMGALGVGDVNPATESSIKAFYRWKREEGMGGSYREGALEPEDQKFRQSMRRAAEAIKNGKDAGEHLKEALGANKTPQQIKASLNGRKLLRGLDAKQIESLRTRIGDSAYQNIVRHDMSLDAWADSI